jgi:hypothetical protein
MAFLWVARHRRVGDLETPPAISDRSMLTR